MITNSKNLLTHKIFIGTGYSKPGIDMLDIETHLIERVLSLAKGNSVYAIDIDRELGIVVAGTKWGYFYYSTHYPGKTGILSWDKYLQGSPILSVFILDHSRAVASDLDGQCLIWDLNSKQKPDTFPTEGEVIFSLFRLGDDHLAGISMTGRLFIWDVDSLEQIAVFDIPNVPPLSALVNPVFWPEMDSWIWPGDKGQIVIYGANSENFDTIAAHDGDFYAISICQDMLLTAGRDDGLLKLWRAGDQEPAKIHAVSHRIVSATAWPADACWKILLSRDDGVSELFQYQESELVFSQKVAVRYCRAIAGIDVREIESSHQMQTCGNIQGICEEIRTNISRNRFGSSNQLYKKLQNHGFENIMHWLRGQEALAKSDRLMELEAYFKLSAEIDMSANYPFGFRYLHLLQEFWLIERAHSLYCTIKNLHEARNDPYLARLNSLLDILRQDKYVIEPVISLDLIIQAFLLLDFPISGRFALIKCDLPPIVIDGSSKEFIDRFNESKKKSLPIRDPLPIDRASWLSGMESQTDDLVIFGNDDPELKPLELCVRFIHSAFSTTTNLYLLFNTEQQNPSMTAREHNQQLINKLSRIQQSKNALGLMRTTSLIVNYIVRQFITKGKAQMRSFLKS